MRGLSCARDVRRILAVYEESAEVNRKLGTQIPLRLKGRFLTHSSSNESRTVEKKQIGFDFNFRRRQPALNHLFEVPKSTRMKYLSPAVVGALTSSGRPRWAAQSAVELVRHLGET